MSYRASAGGTSVSLLDPYISIGGTLYGANNKEITDPSIPSWSWLNQGTATLTTSNGAQTITTTGTSGNPDIKARYISAPGTPYTVTACIEMNVTNVNYTRAGIGFRESATSKITTINMVQGSSVNVDYWNTEISYGSSPVQKNWVVDRYIWLKISNNGTNLTYSVSKTGDVYIDLSTTTLTAFFTTGPDQIHFFINPNSAEKLSATLLSWSVA